MENKLFAPPSKKELESLYFSPPTEQELKIGSESESFAPQASLEGFGNAALSGYLPQAQAALGGLIPNPNKGLDQELRKKGFTIQQPEDSYLTRRDENLARQERHLEENPKSYLGGSLAGILATAPAYGKGVQALTRGAIGKGALTRGAIGGAAQGLIQNPGDIEKEISPVQLEKRLEQGGEGALVGGLTGGAGRALYKTGEKLGNVKNALKDWADLKSFKAIGGMLSDFREAQAKSPLFDPTKRMKELGRALYEKGLAKGGNTFEQIAQGAAKAREEAGNAIGAIFEIAEKRGKEIKALSSEVKEKLSSSALNAQTWANELKKRFLGFYDETGKLIQKGELQTKAGGLSAIKAVEDRLTELGHLGNNASIMEIHRFRKELDHLIDFTKRTSESPVQNQTLKKIRNFINEKIEQRIEALDGIIKKDTLSKLKEANKQYSIWTDIHEISQDRVWRELRNRTFSLTDTSAAIGSGSVGALAGLIHGGGNLESLAYGTGIGLLGGKAHNLIRRYGNPALVQGAHGISKIVPEFRRPRRALGLLTSNPEELSAGVERLRSSQ